MLVEPVVAADRRVVLGDRSAADVDSSSVVDVDAAAVAEDSDESREPEATSSPLPQAKHSTTAPVSTAVHILLMRTPSRDAGCRATLAVVVVVVLAPKSACLDPAVGLHA